MYKTKGIISTGFFRTGSTFFFSCLRQVEQLMCFYEPYHPEILSYVDAEKNGIFKADKNALGHTVEGGYFEEYAQLDFNEFSSLIGRQNRASNHPVLMEETSGCRLRQYIEFLQSEAISLGRVPVLQANRFNLALPWIKTNFPEYITVLITRNPWRIFCSLENLARKEGRFLDYSAKNDNFWNVSEFFHAIVLHFFDEPVRFFGLNYYQQLYFGCKFCELYVARSADLIFDSDSLSLTGVNQIRLLLNSVSVESSAAEVYLRNNYCHSESEKPKSSLFDGFEAEVDELMAMYFRRGLSDDFALKI